MRRARKFFIVVVTAATLVLGVLGAWIDNKLTDAERGEVADALTTVRDTSHQAIRAWLAEHEAAAMVWANTHEVQQAAAALLALDPVQETLLNATAQHRLRAWLDPVHRGKGYLGFFIINPDNINLGSSRDTNVGLENLLVEQNDFFAKIWSGETATSSPVTSDVPLPDNDRHLRADLPTMFVGAPILSKDGKVIAAFAFRLDPGGEFSTILSHGRIGSTGETYAFDRRGRLISESRFDAQLRDIGLIGSDEHSTLVVEIRDPGVNLTRGLQPDATKQERPLTKMARQAINGNAGLDLDGYRDYRGVTVVGAWVWDDALGFGIATEQDIEEAFGPLHAVQLTVYVFTALTWLLVIGLAGLFLASRDSKRAQQAFSDSESRLRLLLESVGEGVYGVNLQGRCTFINPTGVRLLGYQDAAELVGKDIHSVIHHTRRDGSPCLDEECHVYRAFREGKAFHVDDEILWREDGTCFDVEYRSNPIKKSGAIVGSVSTFVDVSERKQTENKLRQAATVFDNTDEAIFIADANRHVISINAAFTRITGFTAEDVLGKNPRFQSSGLHDEAFYEELWRSLQTEGQWRGEIWDKRKDGEVYPAWENITAVNDDAGNIINYVSVFSDISALKESQQRLDHLAHHDTLTGLPNRLLFNANLDQALERAKRYKKKLAVLFLDLDRFKLVNDSMGHDFGDKLLQTVAARLTYCLRAEDTVARLGGDEFTIVLAEIGQSEDAGLLADKIIQTVAEPVRIDDKEMRTSTSIGISLFPDDADNRDGLIKAADTAMYHAKSEGRNNFQFFTEDLTEKAFRFLTLERQLQDALRKKEFLLYYQPQISLTTGKIVGVEALLRWQHPERGLLSAADFISTAEQSTLMEPLGEWVLRTACDDAQVWQRAGLPPIRVAVNVSARQFFRRRSLGRLHAILRDCPVKPATLQLDLEITESALENTDYDLTTIDAVKSLGVMLAIDDFGTGYSSLSRLKQLPIDMLKIDQSFLEGVPGDPGDEAIIAGIIGLARGLELKVIAEGVETEKQLAFLRLQGCDEIQGYLFSEAVPAENIHRLLADDSRLGLLA